MIFGIPTWLFAVLVFMLLMITSLAVVLIYMVFFKKVSLVVFGANGMPPEIRKASKKRNRLYLNNRVNLPIYKNYLQQGKRRTYFAVKIDELTYIPYNLVDKKEEIGNAESEINRIIEGDREKFHESLKTLNKNYSKTQKIIEKHYEILENTIEKISEYKKKFDQGEEKIFFVFSVEKKLKLLRKQEKILIKKIKKFEDRLKKIEELNKKELSETDKEKLKKKIYGILPSLDVDYDWLSVVADAYEEGSKRFEFGITKFAPIIAVVVVSVMCIIGTIAVVKYNTQMTPIEAEAYAEFGDDIKTCSEFFSEWQKDQIELARVQNLEQEVNIPR